MNMASKDMRNGAGFKTALAAALFAFSMALAAPPGDPAAAETGLSETSGAEALQQEIRGLEARYQEGMAAVLDELRELGVKKTGKEEPYIGRGCSECGRETCTASFARPVIYFPRGLGIGKNKKIDQSRSGLKGDRILRYSQKIKNQKKLKQLFDIQTELERKKSELAKIQKQGN